MAIKPRFHSLVIGPTGTGKSTLAAMLADKTGAALMRISAPAWMPSGAHNRATKESLRLIAQHIASNERSILFIDEIDKLWHETSWNSYIRGELFELLDGRWPTGLKPEEDDEDEDTDGNLQILTEKLRSSTFVLAAGTFQNYFEIKQEKPKSIGFIQQSKDEGSPIVTADALEKLPRELTNRFNSNVAILPPLLPENYQSIVEDAAKSLPNWLQPHFETAAKRKLPEAITSQKGCRFIEEAILEALENRLIEEQPEKEADQCAPS